MRFFLTLQAVGSIIFLFSTFVLPSNFYILAVLSIFLSVNTVGLSYYLLRSALMLFMERRLTRWEKIIVTTLAPGMVGVLVFVLIAFLYVIWSQGASLEWFQTFANTFAGVSTLLLASFGLSYLSLRGELEKQLKRAQELEVLRIKAEFNALRARVDPHFIFNALSNAVSMLELGSSKTELVEYLNALADLLRRTVGLKDFCSLREEFEIAEKYLKIQKTRFPDLLSYSLYLPEELGSISVPALVLQPLVENAVVHNVGKCNHRSIEVVVEARVEDSRLFLRVRDNGCGKAKVVEDHGLWLVKERLRLYSHNASLELASEPNAGTTVTVVMPYGKETNVHGGRR